MIAFLLDTAYVAALLLALPWLLYKAIKSGKYRAGLGQKLFGLVPVRIGERPCVWLHAVSVGEVLLLRAVVRALAERRADLELVISTTTNTGMEVARQHFAQHTLCYIPLDFSWAVSRALRRLRPDLVALAELELWPNFIAAARRHGARVAVINGRMSPRSRHGYGRIRYLLRRVLGQIDAFGLQSQEYARRFAELGAPTHRLEVTGSVKYDGIETDRENPDTRRLRSGLGISATDLVWVAGSTSDPEESLVLDVFEKLSPRFRNLRLILVPRHKERFDEVAQLIRDRGHFLMKRSQLAPSASHDHAQRGERGTAGATHRPPVILVDTLGELSAVWGLADLAFVGGSFAPRGGQNMIEPAGYGAAVLFGPGVWNFQDTVDHLLACRGAVQVTTPQELEIQITNLLENPQRRSDLGHAARRFVSSQHGATARTIDLLLQFLPTAEHVTVPHCSHAGQSERAA